MTEPYQRWGHQEFDFPPLPSPFVALLNAHWRGQSWGEDDWSELERAYQAEQERLQQRLASCWCQEEARLVSRWAECWSGLSRLLTADQPESLYRQLIRAAGWQDRWTTAYGCLSSALRAAARSSAPFQLVWRSHHEFELQDWQARLARCRRFLGVKSMRKLRESWAQLSALLREQPEASLARPLLRRLKQLEVLRHWEQRDEDHRRQQSPATLPWLGYELERAQEEDCPAEVLRQFLRRFLPRWEACAWGLLLPPALREQRLQAIERALGHALNGPEDELSGCLEHLQELFLTLSQEVFRPLRGSPQATYLELFSRLLAGRQPDVALDDLLSDCPPELPVLRSCEAYLLDPRPETLLQAAQQLASPGLRGDSWHCPFCDGFRDITQWRCSCGLPRPAAERVG